MTVLLPHERVVVQRSYSVNSDVERPEVQTEPAVSVIQPDPTDREIPDAVSIASMDSFPASDPPSWTGFQFGPPVLSER